MTTIANLLGHMAHPFKAVPVDHCLRIEMFKHSRSMNFSEKADVFNFVACLTNRAQDRCVTFDLGPTPKS